MPTITSTSPQKLREFIQVTVRQELFDLLGDPDFGMELRESAINRLKRSLKSAKAGRVTDIKEVIAELKLEA